MKRAFMAVLAALALTLAWPLASAPAKAAPVLGGELAAAAPSLTTKAHSARWYYVRRHYRPYYHRHHWRPYRHWRRHHWRHHYWRPYRHHWRHHHWHRAYWGPRW